MDVMVGTAAGTGQIKNTRDHVLSLEFHARSTNEGSVYGGMSDVTVTNGRELAAGESVTFNFTDGDQQGSVLLSKFYAVIGTAGDQLDWTAIIR